MIQIISIFYKEFIELKRDKITLFVMFIFFPIFLILMSGYALKFEVDNLDIGIIDLDTTSYSESLVEKIADTDNLVVHRDISLDNYQYLIDTWELDGVLIIPAEFYSKISTGETSQVSLIIDGKNPLGVKTMQSELVAVFYKENEFFLQDYFDKYELSTSTQPLKLDETILYNEELRDQIFFIPGMIGIILMTITMLLSAISVTKERESGTLEMILVAPISKLSFIVGKILPYILVGIIALVITTIFSVSWFSIPFRGSVLLFFITSLVFIISSLSFGLLFSIVFKNMLQVTLSTVVFIVVSILISGYFYPVESMPQIIQKIMIISPLTHYTMIVRGIMIQGVEFFVLQTPVLLMSLITVFMLLLSVFLFSKKLDY